MMRYEYRVRWRREGRPPRTAILQTAPGAIAKAERLRLIDRELAGEEDSGWDPYTGEHPLEGMPPLVAGPVIERREVGEWEAHGGPMKSTPRPATTERNQGEAPSTTSPNP